MSLSPGSVPLIQTAYTLFVERNGLLQAGPVTIARFVLFESHMGKGGHYEELADYTLYKSQGARVGEVSQAAS